MTNDPESLMAELDEPPVEAPVPARVPVPDVARRLSSHPRLLSVSKHHRS